MKNENTAGSMAYFDRFNVCRILKTQLVHLPDNDSRPVGTETIGQNETVTVWQKNLKHKELGVFDSIEFRLFSNMTKNVSFYNSSESSVRLADVDRIVKVLVDLYGVDDIGKAYLKKPELPEIAKKEWRGRSWVKRERYPINLYMEENAAGVYTLCLDIWGIPTVEAN